MKDLSKFVKAKNGSIVIVQPPNIPILLWFGFTVFAFVANGHAAEVATAIARLFLFAWTYLELTSGDSPIRKLMGLIVQSFALLVKQKYPK